jgi:Xaa-Pro aminopeptidase
MTELITNLEAVSKEIGVNVKERYLSVVLNYDGYKSVAPKIVKKGNKQIVITRHIEKANVEAQSNIEGTFPKDAEVVYYNPYFTFNVPDTHAYPQFVEAFASVVDAGEKVVVYEDLPLEMYQWLQDKYVLELKGGDSAALNFYMYELSKKEVLDRFNLKRNVIDAAALAMIEKSPLKGKLEEYIDKRTDSRFETLEGLMDAEGLDAVLCTSPLGVQEITGHGIKHHLEDGIAALFVKGKSKVYLFATEPLIGYENGKEIGSFMQAVSELAGSGVIGVEEQHFPVGWYKNLGFEKLNLKNAMNTIKLSRENRAWEDLSYYIIAARASVYATDGALDWAKKAIKDGKRITELDVEDKYIALLEDFRRDNNLPLTIDTFWTNCHAGSRSLFPGLATNYPLDESAETLKIDAGVSIIGETGIHHSASDIARTLIFDEKAEKAYRKLEEYMLKAVIPGVKPGMSGDDIYRLAASTVQNEFEYFKGLGVAPDVDELAPVFNRDVGHLMGLQEPVTLFFKKGATQTVADGMVGAIEYQWSIKGFSIGIEDVFLVGPNGGLNFSRDDV